MTSSSSRPRTIMLRDGSRPTLRPIAPEDAELVAASFDRLSDESRYRRFFTLQDTLLPSQLAYLVDVDHRDHEAIIAIDRPSGDAVGIARYVRSTADREVAEVAVTVADDWQQRGLGRALLARLATRAREVGVRRFTAVVMSSNPAAVSLLEGVGETHSRSGTGEIELVVALPPKRGTGAQLTKLLGAVAAGTVLPAKTLAHRVAVGVGSSPRTAPDPPGRVVPAHRDPERVVAPDRGRT